MVPEPGLTPDTPDEQSPVPDDSAGQPIPPGYGYAPQPWYPPQPGYPPPPGYPPTGYPPPGYPRAGAPYPMTGGPLPYPQPYPPAAPAKPPALPVEPKAYHEFYRAPRFRWWKPLAAIGLIGLAWLIESVLVVGIALGADLATGRISQLTDALTSLTPALFLANNVSLGVLIPLAMLVSWLVFGQFPRWLTSIAGGFRWSVFIQSALIAAVPLLVFLFWGGFEGLGWNPDSAFLIVAVLLTTPFQAAGEEYLVRGLLARSIGSWFRVRWLGFAVATAVTSLIFMALHGAGDPWLNAFYLTFGVVASVITWRTGGLEAAIALHVMNNLIGEVSLPFGGLEHLMDRQAGVAGPEVLIQIGVMLLIGGVIYWRAARRKISTTAVPFVHGATSELS